MEIVSQIVDGRLLSQVISLPKTLQNILVEVTVKPAAQNTKQPVLTRNTLRTQLQGSHTESLSGALSSVSLSLDELRMERRACFKNSVFKLTTKRCHSERSEESKTLRCAQGDSACQHILKHAHFPTAPRIYSSAGSSIA